MTFKSAATLGAALLGASALASPALASTLFFQINPNYGQTGQRQAFIFGAANTTGTVTSAAGFNQAFNLGAQGFSVVDVPITSELSANTVQNLGFQINASTNISGYFLNRMPFTTDMTYLIDGSKLGTDYVIATYQNILEDQVSVQATVDNTHVTFALKSGGTSTVTLNAGQTYMKTAGADLTGSRITSDQPISVFSGNKCTNIPTGNSACDHIVEQMPSVASLSTSYLIAQTPRTGTLGNVVRVVATEDNTVVKVDGVTVATLNSGQYYEGRVAGGKQIDASAKVLVAEYLVGQGQAGGASTDPAMTIVPGTDQWLKSYVFATPLGSAGFPSDFISVIVKTADLGSLTVDGLVANAALFTAFGTSGYSFGSIDVSGTTGPFSITANSEFQLLVSGFDNYDSYFTYGGAAFAPGASPPPAGAVPEPATWAMMLAGFGIIGGSLRRRQRTSLSFS